MLPTDVHSRDWRLIAEALAQLVEDPTELETPREERAWELFWAIVAVEGFALGNPSKQYEGKGELFNNRPTTRYLFHPRFHHGTFGKNLLPWSYKYASNMASWSFSDLKDTIAYFEEALNWDFDIDDFDDRFRLQKYIYFANECGLDAPYEYNIYRYGPYSPGLAEDYYEISGTGDSNRGREKLDAASFEELVKNRDSDWLEIAATIHKMKRNFETFKTSSDTTTEIIHRVSNMKETKEEEVRRVYRELNNAL